MIAVTYKHKTLGWMMPYYFKDWDVKNAKKALQQYKMLHGENNAKMETEDESGTIENWYSFLRGR